MAKLTEYLLSPSESKSHLFTGLGFTQDEPEELARALRRLILANEVSGEIPGPFGTKYIIDGELVSPFNKKRRIRTIWILETGMRNPRFVTAYPLPRQKE